LLSWAGLIWAQRVAVVVAWRSEGLPGLEGRDHPDAARVSLGLRYDRGAAPCVGIHLAALLPRRWEVNQNNSRRAPC